METSMAPATTVTSKRPHLATDGVMIGLATRRQEQIPPLSSGNELAASDFRVDRFESFRGEIEPAEMEVDGVAKVSPIPGTRRPWASPTGCGC
jgi:hypothetical protein